MQCHPQMLLLVCVRLLHDRGRKELLGRQRCRAEWLHDPMAAWDLSSVCPRRGEGRGEAPLTGSHLLS